MAPQTPLSTAQSNPHRVGAMGKRCHTYTRVITLKLVQDAAKNAKDPELKQAAEKAAPEVKQHLDMAKQLTNRKSG